MSERTLTGVILAAFDAIRRLFGGATIPVADTRAIEDAMAKVIPVLQRETFAAMLAAVEQAGAPGVGLKASLSLVDPDVVASARAQAAHLVTEVTAEVRAFIADITERAVRGELTWAQAAKELHTQVGLTTRWAKAVENARTETYKALVAKGTPPGRAMVLADAHAERYRTRLIKTRAETIARTEIMTAQNNGRLAGWMRSQQAGLLPVTARKRWLVAPEGTRRGGPCPICAPLAKEAPVLLTEPFSNGRMMPPAHPRCRCTAVVTLKGLDSLTLVV